MARLAGRRRHQADDSAAADTRREAQWSVMTAITTGQTVVFPSVVDHLDADDVVRTIERERLMTRDGGRRRHGAAPARRHRERRRGRVVVGGGG